MPSAQIGSESFAIRPSSTAVDVGRVAGPAASLVLETLLAKFVLNEAVGKRRTAGALLVLCGVLLLAH